MKVSYVGIITIILVITAILFSGCSDPVPTTSPYATQVTATVTLPARQSSSITPEATTIPAGVRIFTGNYHWIEYRNNISVTMPPNPRSFWLYTIKMERSTENYKGTPTIHYKFTTISDYPELVGNTVTVTKDGRIAIHDFYYGTTTGRFLGDTMIETIKGVEKPAVNSSAYYSGHSPEDSPGGYLGIEPFGEMNISLGYLGTESITVPAGNYPDARKYLGKFKDGTSITFWVIPGVPVPVQYQYPDKYLDGVNPFQAFELKGWG